MKIYIIFLECFLSLYKKDNSLDSVIFFNLTGDSTKLKYPEVPEGCRTMYTRYTKTRNSDLIVSQACMNTEVDSDEDGLWTVQLNTDDRPLSEYPRKLVSFITDEPVSIESRNLVFSMTFLAVPNQLIYSEVKHFCQIVKYEIINSNTNSDWARISDLY